MFTFTHMLIFSSQCRSNTKKLSISENKSEAKACSKAYVIVTFIYLIELSLI